MQKLGLNAKFMGIVLLISGSCCGVAWLGLKGMTAVAADLNQIAHVVSPRKDHWYEIRGHQLGMVIRERDYFNETQSGGRKSIADRIDASKAAIEEALVKIEASHMPEQDKTKVAEFKRALGEWWGNHLQVRVKADKSDKDGARELSNRMRTLRQQFESITNEIIAHNKQLLESEYKSAREHYLGTRQLVMVLTLCSVLVGIGLALVMLYYMRRSINAVVRGLADHSDQVEEASQQVAQSAVKLSQATTEQAASLQETAASAQQLTSMVQRNMENAQAASTMTAASQESAQKGQRVVEEMARAIAEINSSNQDIMSEVNESNRQISEITKVIAEIGNKTKVINDIVFQTKLLSFNASVEAARAGEHGRGFAVVAEEVGNLARMSGTAAKEISDMLGTSIQKVDAIVRETKSNVERLVYIGKEKVDAGTRIVGECSGVLEEIVGSISQVARMSSDISSASQEQAQGVQEIGRAVGQLDYVTQTNAGAAEQAAAAADQLSGQARSMKVTVQSLLEIVNGASAFSDSQGHPEPEPKTDYAGDQDRRTRAPLTAAAAAAQATGSSPRPGLAVVSPPAANATGSSTQSSSQKSASSSRTKDAEKATTGKKGGRGGDGDGGGPLKLASGSEVAIPSENDPRFKDV